MAWQNPRYRQCISALLNNTVSIFEHFKKSQKKFELENEVSLQTAKAEFDGLVDDVINQCFFHDLLNVRCSRC